MKQRLALVLLLASAGLWTAGCGDDRVEGAPDAAFRPDGAPVLDAAAADAAPALPDAAVVDAASDAGAPDAEATPDAAPLPDAAAPDAEASADAETFPDVAPPPPRPRLVIVSPGEGALIADDRVALVLRAEGGDASGFSYAVGSAAAIEVVRAIPSGTEATVTVDLVPGPNTIEVVLMDGAGEADREDVVVISQLEAPPVVNVDAPSDSTLVFDETITVRGTIASALAIDDVTLTVGGSAGPVVTVTATTGGATFTVDVPLAVGANTLTVVATDSRGQLGEATVTVSRDVDAVAPTLDVRFPRDGFAVRTTRALFQGTVGDNHQVVEVAVTSASATVTATVDASGRFRAWVDLGRAENTFAVRVTDASSNVTRVVRRVYLGQRIGAGGSHGGMVRGGRLYTWGRNNVGQVGLGYLSVLGDATHPVAPTLVTSTVSHVSLAFGQNASLALDDTGHVWGWGDNAAGQLCLGLVGNDVDGDGTDDFDDARRLRPVQVPLIDDVVAIYRGYSHSMMLRSDGTVWSCGRNTNGQLGDGTTTPRDVPVQAQGLPPIVQISAGSESAFALDAQGRVWAWGRNQYGNLGQGTFDTTPHPAPVMVPGLTDVVMIANGRDHVIAVLEDGTVRAWGLNASNQVGVDGVGGFPDNVPSPVVVPGVTDAVAAYASGNQGFYADPPGRLWGWGQNGSGNLGIPDDEDQPQPTTAVFGVMGIVDAVIGPLQGFALDSTGTVFGWGWSFQGSLGAGAAAISTWGYRIPILVPVPQ